MGRRHADVDERDVGAAVANAGEERVGVADLVDDLEPAVREQVRDPLADERRVVGDHDPHGISARIARAAARLALDDELRVQRLQPVAEARQARIGGGASAADAVVRHDDPERVRVSRSRRTVASEADACLTTFVSASETRK